MKKLPIIISVIIAVLFVIFVLPSIMNSMYYADINKRSDELGEGSKITDKYGRICLSENWSMGNNICEEGTYIRP